MNVKATVPKTWQESDFNEWINKVCDYTQNKKITL
jgi:hypothetical protein